MGVTPGAPRWRGTRRRRLRGAGGLRPRRAASRPRRCAPRTRTSSGGEDPGAFWVSGGGAGDDALGGGSGAATGAWKSTRMRTRADTRTSPRWAGVNVQDRAASIVAETKVLAVDDEIASPTPPSLPTRRSSVTDALPRPPGGYTTCPASMAVGGVTSDGCAAAARASSASATIRAHGTSPLHAGLAGYPTGRCESFPRLRLTPPSPADGEAEHQREGSRAKPYASSRMRRPSSCSRNPRARRTYLRPHRTRRPAMRRARAEWSPRRPPCSHLRGSRPRPDRGVREGLGVPRLAGVGLVAASDAAPESVVVVPESEAAPPSRSSSCPSRSTSSPSPSSSCPSHWACRHPCRCSRRSRIPILHLAARRTHGPSTRTFLPCAHAGRNGSPAAAVRGMVPQLSPTGTPSPSECTRTRSSSRRPRTSAAPCALPRTTPFRRIRWQWSRSCPRRARRHRRSAPAHVRRTAAAARLRRRARCPQTPSRRTRRRSSRSCPPTGTPSPAGAPAHVRRPAAAAGLRRRARSPHDTVPPHPFASSRSCPPTGTSSPSVCTRTRSSSRRRRTSAAPARSPHDTVPPHPLRSSRSCPPTGTTSLGRWSGCPTRRPTAPFRWERRP